MFLKLNYKIAILLVLILAATASIATAQQSIWTPNNENLSSMALDKGVSRQSFPKEFKLFNLDIQPLRQKMMSIVDSKGGPRSVIISLPNANGTFEKFEIFEASNFDADLQAQFPEIRAYSGVGITDRFATLKMSLSPQGIQTMVFRTETDNEFIEPYSQDHNTYAVFKTYRQKGGMPWACSTEDKNMFSQIFSDIPKDFVPSSNAGQLKTMRLAQSCNGEYANYFGATSASQVALVLAAFNATITRSNGVYEKDLGLHLNLIAQTTSVIYYDPATDPYTTLSSWNAQLQAALTANVGEANYDIGHMFGASGGGGNAGCIGCVCVDGQKGSGITSPADSIPQGDNFDIDYVVHEVGHQLGANHTFSMSLESSGQNKEIGSGITIMGYAGITSQDVAPHSIDIYHETSIQQIQDNLATKTCPVTTTMTANHPPVVAAVPNYTIPITTPFALTGSATDPENDPITYNWEQDDNSTVSGAASVASPTKASGPNWLSFSSSTSPTKTFPTMATILAGQFVTGPLPGGDAGTNIEALSSVARTLNFRLTVRDNKPYVPGSTIGQTQFTNTTVTVTAAAGPFKVTSPDTAVTWPASSAQNVTWNVANTTAAPVSTANVKISLSTDGGLTFPIVLAASTPNDGSEVVTIPGNQTTTARIKVEAVGNIYFDVSDSNFTIGPGGNTIPVTVQASPTGPSFSVDSVPYTTTQVFNWTPSSSHTIATTSPQTIGPATYTFTSWSDAGAISHTVSPAVATNYTANYTVQGAPVIGSGGSGTVAAESCVPANQKLDPGETVTVNLPVVNTGVTNTANLVGTLQATGGVTNPGPAQNYGVVVTGGPAVSMPFTFKVDPALICGNTVTVSVAMQDGANNLGTVTYTFTTGTAVINLSQSFDSVTAPALPAGWVQNQTSGTGITWVTSTTSPSSAPNVAFANDPATVNASAIESPSFAVSVPNASLTFKKAFTTESTFDGVVLEIKMGAGAWTDIVTAGGSFVSGGYNATISSNFSSPIAGRQAWSGASATYTTTQVTLPAAANGQNVQLRWLMASDTSVASTGFSLDDVQVQAGVVCTVCTAISRKPVADFDGDGKSDISVFRPSDGNWYALRSTAGFSAIHWGVSSDVLVPGDYDGDGKADYAVWRPSDTPNVTDFYILNSNGFTISGYSHGLTTDIPVPGDFDGDGKADIAVFRPSTGVWYIFGSQGQTTTSTQFGSTGDIPMSMDSDGDGKSNLAVYRPSNNTWYIARNTGVAAQNFDAVQFGLAGDIQVPGDYDGDGKADVAVFRPSVGQWYILRSSDGQVSYVQFGQNGDVPVPGDYDGDGKTDVAVYRNGVWYLNGSTSGFSATSFGSAGDTPIAAKYHP